MSEYLKSNKNVLNILNQYVKAMIDQNNVRDFYLEHETILHNITPFDVFNIQYWDPIYQLSDEEIKSIAGKLVNSFQKGLTSYSWPKENTSLFMKYLLDEGQAIKNQFSSIKNIINNRDDKKINSVISPLIDVLSVIQKRFLKMQNIVFPRLEKKLSQPRPLSILWSLHDDACMLQNTLSELLTNEKDNLPTEAIGKFFFLVLGILQKDEWLVFPIASRLLTPKDWEEMLLEAEAYGYAFIEPENAHPSPSINHFMTKSNALFTIANGSLTLDQLILILDALRIDFTFVDDQDEVAFFNNPSERVFPRSPSIIGRKVNLCHPPKSVHIVEKILEQFRSGLKNEAQFHIKMNNRTIRISYYAVRDHNNKYQGTLEITQDVTQIMQLSGEKRLLDWEE